MTTQTTALLYLRAARASDAAIAEQRRLSTGYAEARGWRVLDVVVDNGVGGMRDAPGLTILRDRIAGGEAQAVIATNLTRISLDPDRARGFARLCHQHGADVCLVEQPINIHSLLDIANGVDGANDENLRSAGETRQ
ncbi:Resolvase, N terminal domain [Tranquillimonas rosea]|uniref:Resolvase, N terminal domain n=1 Tax=Tranquillimonas rosea TaxID=641238 RepID=A0A1H9X4C0_9RHOB|nr:recombinase family protein [Tranquillimonas rosea]SES41002.1 Resolvase, N terminal domain [Tranquillimonas rosea]